MKEGLIIDALALMERTVSDPTLRACLYAQGYGAGDIDLHLDHMRHTRLAVCYPPPGDGSPPLWKLSLTGADALAASRREPIGFRLN